MREIYRRRREPHKVLVELSAQAGVTCLPSSYKTPGSPKLHLLQHENGIVFDREMNCLLQFKTFPLSGQTACLRLYLHGEEPHQNLLWFICLAWALVGWTSCISTPVVLRGGSAPQL